MSKFVMQICHEKTYMTQFAGIDNQSIFLGVKYITQYIINQ